MKSSNVKNGAELMNMGITKIPTLVDPIIPKVGIISLVGTSDIGKSTLLLQLCSDITLNDTFLDFPINFTVTAHNLPSLFAGKSHALLCRNYIKGRDWFDFH